MEEESEPETAPEISLDEFAETMEADLAGRLEKEKDIASDREGQPVGPGDVAEVEEAVAPEQFEPEAEGLDSLAMEEESEPETALDIFPDDLAEAVETDLDEGDRKDLDASFEGPEESEEEREHELEFLESDLGSLSDIEIADESTAQTENGTELDSEILESSPKIPLEDLSEVSPSEKEGIDAEETVETLERESIGLSEERIEAIITRTVHDVVERVARETMTEVAERLITEAIDTLKESLESSDK